MFQHSLALLRNYTGQRHTPHSTSWFAVTGAVDHCIGAHTRGTASLQGLVALSVQGRFRCLPRKLAGLDDVEKWPASFVRSLSFDTKQIPTALALEWRWSVRETI